MEWTEREDSDFTIARTFCDTILSLEGGWRNAAAAIWLPIRFWAKNVQHFHTFIINYSHQIYGVWITILNTFTILDSLLSICRPVRVDMHLSSC